jgi:hypothetical protein
LLLDLIGDRFCQFAKVEQSKCSVTIVVQDSQVILFAKVTLNDKEVGAIALLSQPKGDFVR